MPSKRDDEAGTTNDVDSDDVVRAIGKSGVVLFAGMFLELGIAFLAKFIVARELAAASYGEVTVGLAVLTVFSIVGRLGFESGLPRTAPRYDGADRRGVFVSALVLNVVVTGVLAVVLFVGAGPIAGFLNNPRLESVLRIIAVGVPAIPLMRVAVSGTQAVNRSTPKVIVQNLVHPVTRILFVAAVVLTGATPETIAAAYVASNWFGAIAALLFLVRYTPILETSVDWTPKYREMLTFSIPLMITTGMAFILGNTDTLMIQFFRGSEAVGIYDISYLIANMLTVGVGSLSFLFLPNISELHADEQWAEIAHLFKLVTKWIVFLTIPPFLLVVYFPRLIIENTFGAVYADGAPYLVVLASAYFFIALSGPNKEALTAFGDTKYIMYVNGAAAALNVVLNGVLIVTFGTVGAAIATATSLFVVQILFNFRLYSEYDVTGFSSSLVRPVAVFGATTFGVYLAVRFTVGRPSVVQLAGLVVFAGIVYGLSILGLGGVQSDDVMLINSAEQRFGVDLDGVKALARRLM